MIKTYGGAEFRKMNSLLEISKNLVGRSYELGRSDCFTLVIDYLRLRGVNIPNDVEFKGLTFKNYKDAYLENTDVIDCAVEFLLQYCKEIKLHECLAGDILLLQNESGTKYLGIDGGNGNVITAVINQDVVVTNDCKRLRALRIG